MPSDLDIYRTANLCIQQHGEDAELYAGQRIDELLDAGDIDGRVVWMRVLDAIKELQNTETGDVVH